MAEFGSRPLLLLALFGCAQGAGTTTFADSGSVCLKSTESGSVDVVVTFSTCLSSSCDRVIMSACQVIEKDGTIRVGSHATVEQESGSCTDDCQSLSARCQSAPIAPGTYSVTYGSNMATVTLPTSSLMVFSDGSGFSNCPP